DHRGLERLVEISVRGPKKPCFPAMVVQTSKTAPGVRLDPTRSGPRRGRNAFHSRSIMRIRILLIWLVALAPLAAPAWGQSIPDSIGADGVPAVPAALGQELNRYQNIRSASFQDWEQAPGRRAMLILTRFGNTNQVHRVGFPGGARTQLTFLA